MKYTPNECYLGLKCRLGMHNWTENFSRWRRKSVWLNDSRIGIVNSNKNLLNNFHSAIVAIFQHVLYAYWELNVLLNWTYHQCEFCEIPSHSKWCITAFRIRFAGFFPLIHDSYFVRGNIVRRNQNQIVNLVIYNLFSAFEVLETFAKK